VPTNTTTHRPAIGSHPRHDRRRTDISYPCVVPLIRRATSPRLQGGRSLRVRPLSSNDCRPRAPARSRRSCSTPEPSLPPSNGRCCCTSLSEVRRTRSGRRYRVTPKCPAPVPPTGAKGGRCDPWSHVARPTHKHPSFAHLQGLTPSLFRTLWLAPPDLPLRVHCVPSPRVAKPGTRT